MTNFSLMNKIVIKFLRSIFILIIFFSFFSVSYGAVTIKSASNNGLVLYWNMNQGTGSTVTDLSGNGNTGTLSFTTWATGGVIGPGIDMGSGGSGVISTSDNSSVDFGTGSFTISMWGKYRDLTNPKNYFHLRKGAGCYSGSYPTWELGDSYGGGLRVCIRDASNNLAAGTISFDNGYTPTQLLNSWVNLVVVFNRSTGKVYSYVNGVKQSSELSISNVTGSVNNSSGLSSGLAYGWSQDSIVDEYRMYNRALDDSEIKNLYKIGKNNRVNSNTLSDGLVSYWRFEKSDISGASVSDLSGQGHTGTLSTASEIVGRVGQGAYFNGSSSYFNTWTPSLTDWTIGLWFYATNNGGLFKSFPSGGPFNGIDMYITSGNQLVQIINGNSYYPIAAGNLLNSWHYLTITKSGTSIKTYVDTVLRDSRTGSVSWLENIFFGRSYSYYLNGIEDEIRIYNRQLNIDEITQLYNLGLTKINAPQTNYDASGLVGYWTFNGTDLTTTTATDKSGNGYNGTLQSSPTPYSGKVGQALSFSGANYVSTTLDTQPSAMANTSWSAWVRPTRLNYGVRQAIFETDDGGYDRGLEIEANTSNFAIATGSSFWQPVAADLNAWQHVTVVYTPTSIYFYKNGVQYIYGLSPSGQSTTLKFNIGNSPNYSEYFQGQIDEVMVYNRALNSTEINKSYRKTLK